MALNSEWKLDWNSNDSIWSNNWTDTAITYVTWYRNQCASFNWSTSYITMGNVLDKNWSTAFSIAFFIKYSSTGNDMIVTKQQSSWNFTWYAIWRNATAWKIEFTVVSTPTNLLTLHFPDDYNDWNWHYIVVTYDGSKTPWWTVWYVGWSSVSLSTISNSLTWSSSNTIPFNIGSRNNWNLPTNWLIDEVRIYDNVLSASDVTSLYNSYRNNPNFFMFF
jgi:hypothetical protein